MVSKNKYYNPYQIRAVILKCGKGFMEMFANISPNNDDLRYYYNYENRFIQLEMREMYTREEIELRLSQIDPEMDIEKFDKM